MRRTYLNLERSLYNFNPLYEAIDVTFLSSFENDFCFENDFYWGIEVALVVLALFLLGVDLFLL